MELTISITGDIIIARVQQTQLRTPLVEQFALSTEQLGPLPLVNHFISRLGLIELLDQYVPTTDRRCAVPHATALGVLLRSIVVEREPIYRQVETVHGFAPAMYGLAEQDPIDRLARVETRYRRCSLERRGNGSKTQVAVPIRVGSAFAREIAARIEAHQREVARQRNAVHDGSDLDYDASQVTSSESPKP